MRGENIFYRPHKRIICEDDIWTHGIALLHSLEAHYNKIFFLFLRLRVPFTYTTSQKPILFPLSLK